MASNDKNFLEAHKAYFSNIRHRNGYYQFSQVAKDILTHRANAAPTVARYGNQAFNHDQHPSIASAALFAEVATELVFKDYPLYYLSQPIIEEFLATDLSDISRIIDTQFNPPLPIIFVAFPQKLLTDNDGDYVTHALIEIVTDLQGRRLLKVCCNLRRPGMSASSISIASDYLFAITEKGLNYGRIIGLDDTKESLASFASSPEGRLASIACQVMLILSIGDEYIDEGTALPFAVKPVSGKGNTSKLKVPRTIRLPKTGRSGLKVPSGIDSNQSRRPHWRRGHWRNQAYGPNNTLRKLIWIRPERIGKSAEQTSTVA